MSDGLKKAHERVERIRKKGSEGLARFTAIRFMLWFHGEVQAISKELQSAKAENGRLVKAIKKRCSLCSQGHPLDTKNPAFRNHVVNGGIENDRGLYLCDLSQEEENALSSSNALNYWQGEMRKARAEIWSEAIEEAGKTREILLSATDVLKGALSDDWPTLKIRKQMRNEIVKAMKYRQSNQSKAEKGKGEGIE